MLKHYKLKHYRLDKVERKIKKLKEAKVSIVENSAFTNGDLTEKEWKKYCKLEEKIERLEVKADKIEGFN